MYTSRAINLTFFNYFGILNIKGSKIAQRKRKEIKNDFKESKGNMIFI